MKPILAVLLLLPTAALALDEAMIFTSTRGRDYAIAYVEGGFTVQATDLTQEVIDGSTVRGVEVLHPMSTPEARREFLPQLPGGFVVASTAAVLAVGAGLRTASRRTSPSWTSLPPARVLAVR